VGENVNVDNQIKFILMERIDAFNVDCNLREIVIENDGCCL